MGTFNYRTDPRSIIKFPDSARNRNPEEYKGTVFYRTFVLLAPFYNSGTTCIYIYITLSASVSTRIDRFLGTIILTNHSRNGRPDFGDLPAILSYFRSLMALGLHQVLNCSVGSSPNQCWEIRLGMAMMILDDFGTAGRFFWHCPVVNSPFHVLEILVANHSKV